MLEYGLIIGVVLYYFYTVTCIFFSVQIARLKGRKRGWGWLGLFLGLIGLMIVCFLPNAKGVTGETNPLKAAFRKVRGISPVATWIVVAGAVVVAGGALLGNRLTLYLENRAYVRELSDRKGDTQTVLSPSTVQGKVQAVCAGDGNNFAITESGDLYGWGSIDLSPLDESGRLYEKAEKIQVVGDTCFLLTQDHVLYAKGDNSRGLILGQTANRVDAFVKIEEDVADFSASSTAAALIKRSGNLYLWGLNTYGQLGREAERASDTNTRLAGNVTKVAVTPRSVFYRTENGDVFALGSNAYGQFGLGSRDTQSVPVCIVGDCRDFAAGTDFLLVLKNDGTVWSAGNDSFGQLGRATAEELEPEAGTMTAEAQQALENAAAEAVFGQVENLAGATAVYAAGHTAFALIGSELYAWGENTLGQLGTGDRSACESPKLVHRKAAAVSAGGACTLLLTEEGKLLGAGDRSNYQLGARSEGEGFREIAAVKEGA